MLGCRVTVGCPDGGAGRGRSSMEIVLARPFRDRCSALPECPASLDFLTSATAQRLPPTRTLGAADLLTGALFPRLATDRLMANPGACLVVAVAAPTPPPLRSAPPTPHQL
eukprot:154304-Chlamydomonas_euryale.AAC.5